MCTIHFQQEHLIEIQFFYDNLWCYYAGTMLDAFANLLCSKYAGIYNFQKDTPEVPMHQLMGDLIVPSLGTFDGIPVAAAVC